MIQEGGHRRIDRIRRPEYLEGLAGLSLQEVRRRRDECSAEEQYLSYLRRMVQGRAEILKGEIERRRSPEEGRSLIERLSEVLAPESSRSPSRGSAVHVGVPDEEILMNRRRTERLVSDPALSSPGDLSDEQLDAEVDTLLTEERTVSSTRAEVIQVLDALQDELKRRYKEDVSQVLS